MKSIKILSLFTMLFFSLTSGAQTIKEIKKLPVFKNEIVVIKTFEGLGSFHSASLDISDGSDLVYYTEYESMNPKNQPENASILAQVLNELKKQKYKLISSNSGGGGQVAVLVTTYILQKE